MRQTQRYASFAGYHAGAVNTLIRSKDQVVAHRQLVELGFPERTIRNRTVPGGPWQRILPRTSLTQTGPPSPRQLARSALLYGAPDSTRSAALTGVTALELYGLRRVPRQTRVHVLVPVDNQRATTGHVIMERTTRMPAHVIRSGLACAPFVRALIDAARRSWDLDEVRAVLAEAVQRRFCTPRQILDEVRDGPVRHSQLARRVALEIADGVRSPAEGWFREAFIRFQVPPPRWNAILRDTATGQVVAIPDALWTGCCLIVEVDSRDYHLSPEDWRRTQERHAMLTALGFVVLHFAPSRVRPIPKRSAPKSWPRSPPTRAAPGHDQSP